MNPIAVALFCTPFGCLNFPPPPPPRYYAPPPAIVQQQCAEPAPPPRMNEDQQREYIIQQGNAFCNKYPHDKMCHWREHQ